MCLTKIWKFIGSLGVPCFILIIQLRSYFLLHISITLGEMSQFIPAADTRNLFLTSVSWQLTGFRPGIPTRNKIIINSFQMRVVCYEKF